MGNYSDGFGRDLLQHMNFPVTDENLRALKAWAQAEGGEAKNNPFNTTQAWPGATDYNSVHVRNYADYSDGLAATLKTLQGPYQNIRTALGKGDSALAVAQAVVNSPWGTSKLIVEIVQEGHSSPQPVDVPPTIRNDSPQYHQPVDVVKRWQHIVNVPADGKFGPLTEKATRVYQTAHNLGIDGIVGPKTWGYALSH